MTVRDACSRQEMVEKFGSATLWLETNADQIDSLNVLPVPDGDTRINMLLTIRSADKEASLSTDKNASANVGAIHSGQPQYNYIISVE
jgi:dihydroxyacetone kinase-like predicted kinase